MAANLNVGFSGDLNGNLGDHGEELGDLDSSHRSKDVEKKRDSEKGCQMAIVRFLDGMCLSLLPSVLWLCYSALQNLIPSFPWIAPPCPPPWHNPRKGRDQILPSGNLGYKPATLTSRHCCPSPPLSLAQGACVWVAWVHLLHYM